jgi:hypothetical protein
MWRGSPGAEFGVLKRIFESWLWCCEKCCARFGGCGFEFRDGEFFFGEILVVAEKWVEIVGWGFESVEAGIK